jgi:hypothetical protein
MVFKRLIVRTCIEQLLQVREGDAVALTLKET